MYRKIFGFDRKYAMRLFVAYQFYIDRENFKSIKDVPLHDSVECL